MNTKREPWQDFPPSSRYHQGCTKSPYYKKDQQMTKEEVRKEEQAFAAFLVDNAIKIQEQFAKITHFKHTSKVTGCPLEMYEQEINDCKYWIGQFELRRAEQIFLRGNRLWGNK